MAYAVLPHAAVISRATLVTALALASLATGCEEMLGPSLGRSTQSLRVEGHPRLHLTPALRLAAARIPLSAERWSDRPSEIVATLDVHSDPGATDEAMDALRAQALLQGGDAILGVEFHHDPSTGESWLTGSAVRFLNAPVETEAEQTATPAIPLFAADSLDRPTEVIGMVRVELTPNDPTGGSDALRERAGMLGADAVLSLRRRTDGPGPAQLTGLAVRYRDLVAGRNYSVLDRVSVPAHGADDPAALDALRARARTLGADLLVNIALSPSSSPGQPDQLAGDAVHVRVAPRD